MQQELLTPRQLWEEVASILRRDILNGTLTPGTRLIEMDLAVRFGVSRGPIREALRELERSGLAVNRPRRGVFVSTPTETDLEEITEFRGVLKAAAARIALPKVVPEDIERLRSLLEAMEAANAGQQKTGGLALDLDFHRQIFVLAGNSRMLSTNDALAAQLLLSWAHDHALRENVYPPASLHEDIVNALEAGDERQLDIAVAAHYAWSGDRLLRWDEDGTPRGARPARRRNTRA